MISGNIAIKAPTNKQVTRRPRHANGFHKNNVYPKALPKYKLLRNDSRTTCSIEPATTESTKQIEKDTVRYARKMLAIFPFLAPKHLKTANSCIFLFIRDEKTRKDASMTIAKIIPSTT